MFYCSHIEKGKSFSERFSWVLTLKMDFEYKKMPIFEGFQSNRFTKHQKILWACSLGCKKLLNLICLPMKFHNRHHASVGVCKPSYWVAGLWDVLRTEARGVGQDFQPACVRTNPREGVVGPKLLAEGPKTRSLQWDQFLSKRGGPKSYPAVFRATLGTSLCTTVVVLLGLNWPRS